MTRIDDADVSCLRSRVPSALSALPPFPAPSPLRHGHSRPTILLAHAHAHWIRCVPEKRVASVNARGERALGRRQRAHRPSVHSCVFDRLRLALAFFSLSGIPVARPVTTYSPNPVPRETAAGARTNYPTNSHIDSRESLATREPDLGAYRYIESAGSLTYRAVNLPADKQRATQRDATPDVQMEQGANGAYVPFQPKPQHPNFTTTNNVLGAERPQRPVTEEYRSGHTEGTRRSTRKGGLRASALGRARFPLRSSDPVVLCVCSPPLCSDTTLVRTPGPTNFPVAITAVTDSAHRRTKCACTARNTSPRPRAPRAPFLSISLSCLRSSRALLPASHLAFPLSSPRSAPTPFSDSSLA